MKCLLTLVDGGPTQLGFCHGVLLCALPCLPHNVRAVRDAVPAPNPMQCLPQIHFLLCQRLSLSQVSPSNAQRAPYTLLFIPMCNKRCSTNPCLYLCIHIRTHAHTYTRMHSQKHACAHVRPQTHVHTYTDAHVHTHTHAHTHTHTHRRRHVDEMTDDSELEETEPSDIMEDAPEVRARLRGTPSLLRLL